MNKWRLFRIIPFLVVFSLIINSIPAAASEPQPSSVPPAIIRFSPTRGKAGDIITITGDNFTPDSPGDTAVDFNGVPAEITSLTANEVIVRVPEGVVSGPVRIRTPYGQAVSEISFTTTFIRKIQLSLPAGINSQQYSMINGSGFAQPDTNGILSAESGSQDVNIDSLVNINDPDDYRIFFAVDALQTPLNQTISIDALSTAKGLVFNSPLIFSSLPEDAQVIMQAMDDDPKVTALAQVIESVYPVVADPLNDQRIIDAQQEAIVSVLDRLPPLFPSGVPQSPSPMLEQSLDNLLMVESMSPEEVNIPDEFEASPAYDTNAPVLPVFFKPVDLYMMKYSMPKPGIIKIEAVGDNPLDWQVRLVELSTLQFDEGMKTIHRIPERKGNTVLDTSCGYRQEIVAGTQSIEMIWAKSKFKYIDILGKASDFLFSANIADKGLQFDPTRPGVYAVQMINPALIWMWGTQGTEWATIPGLAPSGTSDALKVLGANVFMGVADAASIWIKFGDEAWLQELMGKLLIKVTSRVEQKFPSGLYGIPETEFTYKMMELVAECSKDAVELAAKTGVKEWEEATAAKAAKCLNKTITNGVLNAVNILAKISKVCALGQRIAYLATGTGLGYSMSPLETLIFVVGNPFAPTISSIIPAEGYSGSDITITGTRFMLPKELNIVLFGQVKATVKSASETQIVVEVPHGISYGDTTVAVKTTKGWTDDATFRVVRKPEISKVTPVIGFTPAVNFPESGQNYQGSKIVIEGSGFYPWTDTVTIGGKQAGINPGESISTRLVVNMPVGCTGGPVVVRTLEGQEGSWSLISVYGPPVITQKTYEEPMGKPLVIPVDNITSTRSEIDIKIGLDELSIPPLDFTINKNGTVTVWIQSGITSGTLTITTPAGSDTATFNFPVEAGITYTGTLNVNSTGDDYGTSPNLLSLREAAGAAAGTYVLWDDQSDSYTRDIYTEQQTGTDSQDNPVYSFVLTQHNPEPESVTGPDKGGPGHETREVWDEYHDHLGGVDYRHTTIDLDSGDSPLHQPEEADRAVLIVGGNTYVPGSQTIDDIKVPAGTITLTQAGTFKIGDYDRIRGLYEGTNIQAGALSQTEPLFELIMRNEITNLSILNSPATAFLMGEGAHNNLVSANVKDCRSTAVQVGHGAFSNRIEVNVDNCTGTGLLLGPGATANSFVGSISRPTENGVLLTGVNTDFNIIDAVVSGSSGGWGLVIEGGARSNTVNGKYISNQAGGIRVTGEGTNYNKLQVYSGYDGTTDNVGNQGDGILIDGGAKSTRVSGYIGNNLGDGLRISGAGTEGTTVSSLNLGSIIYTGYHHIPNANGIRISNGASGTEMSQVQAQGDNGYELIIEGENTCNNILHNNSSLGGYYDAGSYVRYGEGGVIIRNGANGNQILDSTLHSSAGFAVTLSNCGNETSPNLVSNNYLRRNLNGILVDTGAHHNIIEKNTINSQSDPVLKTAAGIIVRGSGTSYNSFWSNTIQEITGIGILVENGADYNRLLANNIRQAGTEGLIIDNSIYTFVPVISVQNCSAGGIILRNNADHTVLGSSDMYSGFITGNVGHGIVVDSASSDIFISGIVAYENLGDGILIQGQDTCRIDIKICHLGIIGFDVPFPVNGNTGNGIHVTGNVSSVNIGGFTHEEANHIANNGQWGVKIENGVSGVNLYKNYLGINCDGVTPLGNNGGISIQGSRDINIGGSGLGNLISANHGAGIKVSESGNVTIFNNLIGTDINGNIDLGNEGDGIEVTGGVTGIVIGDTSEDMRNVISGNSLNGIYCHGDTVTGIRISGNYLGTDVNGLADIGNIESGILLADGIAEAVISRNLISGNDLSGISITGVNSMSNMITGNKIGINANGNSLGNAGKGISVGEGASFNRIEKNVIKYNAGDGVSISEGAYGNTINECSISRNGGKGIALDNGNTDILSPWITDQNSGIIQGETDLSIPDFTLVQVFSDPEDEGLIFLGTTYVMENRFVLYAPVSAGVKVTATLTDGLGNTSEFGSKGLKTQPLIIPLSGDVMPAMVPELTSLVFTSNSSENQEIYYMASMSSDAIQLTNTPEPDYHPAISPDGTKVVFVSERDGNSEIYIVGIEGSGIERLTSNSVPDYDPVWSPDGNQIVFVSEIDGNPEIYRLNINGTELTRLTDNSGIDKQPALSYDGSRIAFISNRDGNDELYILNIATEDVVRLTNDPAADYQPSWSFGDTGIYFISERDGNPELYVTSTDGTVIKSVSDSSAAEKDPSSIPGTNWIVFSADYDGEAEIYACQSGGQNIRRLTVRMGTSIQPDVTLTSFDIMYGDANRDYSINVLDISKVVRIILTKDVEIPEADANRDGAINVFDLTKIARIILGLN